MNKPSLAVLMDSNIVSTDNEVEWKNFRIVNEYYDCTLSMPTIVHFELAGLRIEKIREKYLELDVAANGLLSAIRQGHGQLDPLQMTTGIIFDPTPFLKKSTDEKGVGL
ncbi:MAG: hypothetical protein U0103_23085, partial [Candidatus Obscuribacterales bacterium]